MPLPRPLRGGCTRARIGSAEVLLETVRGGHSLLWSNGRATRRYALGLHAAGQLTLQLRAPKLPLHVVPREIVTLVSGGRLAGYVVVSLVPTVCWHSPGGSTEALLELQPDDLAAEWDETEGHLFTAASPLCVRFPVPTGEPRAVVPLRLRNDSAAVCTPGFVPLTIHDDELTPMRGSIVVPPRRLRWTGERFATGSGPRAALGEAS